MVLWIVSIAVGSSLLVGVFLVGVYFCLRKIFNRSDDTETESSKTKFKGIASHPSFRAAIQQSFATTTTNTAAILNTVSDNYYYDTSLYTYMTCPTCALIAEGSSMAYSDNTCPQCGADTSHLTDSSINPYA